MPRHTTIEPDPSQRHRSKAVGVIALILFELGGIVLLLVGQLVVSRRGFPFAMLTQDIVAQTDLPYFAGYFSHLGAMLWCIAATVCLFTYLVARGLLGRPWEGIFLFAGLLSALLMADDLFLLHEEVLRRTLGTSEPVVFATYAILLVVFLLRYARTLIQTHPALLVISLMLFAVSVSIDVGVVRVPEHRRHLVEDGSKLLGVANWAGYFVVAAWSRMSAVCRARYLG